jgi:protein O-mannosyl-transferase
MNAAVSYVKYIVMMFYPADLAIWYPYPEYIPVWQAAGAVIFLAAVTFVCFRLRDAHRYLLTGWLIFLGTLVPVIGIVQVGGQAMADRYTYVPYFGLFIMLAFGLDAVLGEAKRKVFVGIFAAAAIAFAWISYVQAGYWKNSETIYTRTLAVTSGNYMASGNLCLYFATNDRAAEAEPLCREAIAVNPDFPLAYNSLGIALMKQQRFTEAEAAFRDYVARSPRDVIGYANLATAQIIQGRPEDAETNLKTASEINDGTMSREAFGSAIGDLAAAYALRGNFEKAVESYTRQVNLFPDAPQFRFRLASAMFEAKRFEESREQAGLAAQMGPNDADTANLTGKLLLQSGKRAEAEAEFQRALGINPEHPEAKSNLQKARGEK